MVYKKYVLSLIFAISVLFNCGDGGGSTLPPPVIIELDPVRSVIISQDTLEIIEGNTSQITATITTDGVVSDSVLWVTSNSSVVTVNTSGVVTAKTAGVASITAESVVDNSKFDVVVVKVVAAGASVTSVRVSPSNIAISTNSTVQLNATVEVISEAPENVIWSSSSDGIATVDVNGLVTGVAEGTVTITATSEFDNTKVATSMIEVSDQPIDNLVNSVNITSTNNSEVTQQQTLQLNVNVSISGNANDSLIWSSSSDGIATVDVNGLVTGVAEGTVTITATSEFDPTKLDTVLIVVVATAEVVGVAVNTSLDVPSELDAGSTIQLLASVDARGGASESVLWSTASDLVSVDSNGLVTATEGVSGSGIIVTATSKFDPSQAGIIILTVLGPSVDSVKVTAAGGVITGSLAPNTTLQLQAEVFVQRGAATTVNWSSSSDGIATVDASGLVTSIAEGTAIITAESTEDDSKRSNFTLNVNILGNVISVSIINPNVTVLGIGESLALRAQLQTEGGASDAVTWLSLNESIATVTSTGLVTGAAVGAVTITVTSTFDPTKSDSLMLTILPPSVTSVVFDPIATIEVGDTVTLGIQVVVVSQASDSVTLVSSNPSVAKVDDMGRLIVLSSGTTTVTATSVFDNTKEGNVVLNVVSRVIAIHEVSTVEFIPFIDEMTNATINDNVRNVNDLINATITLANYKNLVLGIGTNGAWYTSSPCGNDFFNCRSSVQFLFDFDSVVTISGILTTGYNIANAQINGNTAKTFVLEGSTDSTTFVILDTVDLLNTPDTVLLSTGRLARVSMDSNATVRYLRVTIIDNVRGFETSYIGSGGDRVGVNEMSFFETN